MPNRLRREHNAPLEKGLSSTCHPGGDSPRFSDISSSSNPKNVSAAEQISAERMTQMKSVLSNSLAQNTKLQKDHRDLLDKLDAARKRVGTDPQLLAQLIQLQMLEGTQEVEGPGIQISIDDRNKKGFPYALSTDDLARMINTLKFAGAEAISINGQRIVGSTAIVLSGSSTILVNQVPINRTEGISYELNAIGDQDTLLDYFSKLEASNLKQNRSDGEYCEKNSSVSHLTRGHIHLSKQNR